MPLDGFTLHFLTEELRRDIVGCRVEKVHQPSKDELVMHLRDRNGAVSYTHLTLPTRDQV